MFYVVIILRIHIPIFKIFMRGLYSFLVNICQKVFPTPCNKNFNNITCHKSRFPTPDILFIKITGILFIIKVFDKFSSLRSYIVECIHNQRFVKKKIILKFNLESSFSAIFLLIYFMIYLYLFQKEKYNEKIIRR